jgi:glycosyltransferase involved in cell wall biosynthesis
MDIVPFISVCIPTYKNPAYVLRLLNSVTIQTYTDFEVVITDNSPDNAVELVVEQFKNRLPIRYQRNVPAVNMGENFNKGLQNARGRWIKMMHDDDWFNTSDALEKFAQVARQTNSTFIFCAYQDVNATRGKIHKELLPQWKKELLEENPLNLFFRNVIGHPSTVMHINDHNLQYDPEFNWVIDIDFYMRFLTRYAGFTYIPEFLVNIGIDENQMSATNYKNPKVEIPEYLSLLGKYPQELAFENENVFHMLWELVRKFRIRNWEDIRKAGFNGVIPEEEMRFIINYQKKIPRIILKQTPWSAKLMRRSFQSFKKVSLKKIP